MIGRGLRTARSTFSDPDVPPKSWLLTMGGVAGLSIPGGGASCSRPGLSWRREFARQYIFSFRVTLVPATVVAFVIGFSTIGIQGGSLASAFGAIDRISAVAPIAFLRELGPLLTSAIVAGTLGSTITAEIGARKIRQEIEALEMLGINPVRNLVLPGRRAHPDDAGAQPAHLLGGDRRHLVAAPSSTARPRAPSSKPADADHPIDLWSAAWSRC